MKVIVNQQVIRRPEVVKPIKPGFQNFGKNVKINNLGQLVTQSEEAKELKKAFGLENAFKDIGYQNIGEKIVIEPQNTGQNAKDFVSQNLSQKDEKESKFGFQNIIQNAEGKGSRPVTPPGLSVIQNAKGKGNRPVTPPGQSVSQNNGKKGRSINTLA
ncbi:MAG: hypothetical protein ACE5GU_11610 [Candidatus Scalinduaceae bacterium]